VATNLTQLKYNCSQNNWLVFFVFLIYTVLLSSFFCSAIIFRNFEEWLRVWRMDVSERNVNNSDLLAFAKATQAKSTDLITSI